MSAFGPYQLFQVDATGFRFATIALDNDHYVVQLYKASGSVLATDELCLSGLVAQSTASAQTPRPATASSNSFGAAPQNMAVGDFNGDGVPDVALTAGGNSVGVFLSNSDHTLGSPVSYPVGAGSSSAVAADFNGDGKLDLAVANLDSNNVSILLGKGDGTFQPAVNYAAGAGPASLAVGDFNGDGKMDLAVSNLGSFGVPATGVSILLGNGDGTFQAPAAMPIGASPLSLVSADFNGDGKADLAVANSSGTTVSILLGNGNGTFQAPVAAAAGLGPLQIAYGDFDGDGKPDLAVIHRGTSVLSILLGKGDGTFQAPADYITGEQPETLDVVDVHGDGTLDVLVGGGSNYIAVVMGNGDGTFHAPPAYAAGGGPQAMALADVNGDGKPDVITANVSTNDVSVLLGAGGALFGSAIEAPVGSGASSQLPQPVDLVAADFTGDGKIDVATADQGTNDVAILAGKGDGTFGAAVHFPAGVNPSSIAAGDFNGDGKLDLAVANTDFNSTLGAGNVSVLLGNGNGTFHAPANLNAGTHPVRVKAGDFNGDGKLDLAVLNAGSSTAAQDASVSILLGNGNGTFQAAKNYAIGANGTALAVGDLNGDGKLDIVAASQAADSSYNLAVMLGKGDGTFAAPEDQPTESGARSIAIADVNLDGVPDLIVAHCCGTTDMTYAPGKGDGTFQPEIHFPGGDSPTAVVAGDLNGDGRPDALVTAGGSGAVGSSTVAVILNTFAPPGLANVNAASFVLGPVTAESIVSAFGGGLATGVAIAKQLPLPANLNGTTVTVKDSLGTSRQAPLFYVSPGQVNYEVPAGTALGTSTVTIAVAGGSSSTAQMQIAPVAPGIFMLNSASLVAANVLRVKPGNVQSYEPVYQVDSVTHQVTALPIDLGLPSDQIYLLIYGTGIRGRSSLSNVSVTIGGVAAKVSYAGPQGGFVGLDQVNVLVSASLAGRGTVNIIFTADGKTANTSTVSIK